MPPKRRDLISELKRLGFEYQGNRGSHRKFRRPDYPFKIIFSGKAGEDAKNYQIKANQLAREGIGAMKDSDRYLKIFEWSETDHCYVGSAPGLFLGGCHGDE